MQAQQRAESHLKAKGLMREGQFRDAINEILHAISQFGNHVGLMSDLAVCFYRSGQMHKWRSALQKLSFEFTNCREKLSAPSRLRTALILAKFYDEEGDIHSAIGILHREAESVTDITGSSEEQLKVLANLVRLQALIGRSAGLSTWCRSLEQAKAVCSEGTQIEIEHALMLHDLELLGSTLAFNRLDALLKRPGLDLYDRELALYDYIEASMAAGQTQWPEAVTQLLSEPVDSAFAQLLKSWLNTSRTEAWVWRPAPELRAMTCNEFMRAALLYVRQVDLEEAREVKAALDLQLRDLSDNSRNTWTERFRCLRPTHQLLLQSEEQILMMGESVMAFKGKPVAFSFISLLALRPHWPLEEFCRRLLDADLSEENYTRIRVMAFRINRQAVSALGLCKLISVSKQGVALDNEIKISESAWRI